MVLCLVVVALTANAQSLPYRLSEARIFSNLESLEIADGLPYEINVPFWSDGADKRRWLILPSDKGPAKRNDRRIEFRETEAWELPIGAKLVKHFDLVGTTGPFRVETRVMVREESGWRGYSYKWNAAQTDAELMDDGGEERYPVAGGRVQLWRFPSRFECLSCHQTNAGSALGMRTLQLNRVVNGKNQILDWSERGVFSRRVDCVAQLPKLVDPWDPTQPLEFRARAYLDSNCSYCHRPGGSGSMDLRYETPTERTHTVGERVTGVDPYDPQGMRILAGDPEHSAVWRRVSTKSSIQMPPLGRITIDARGSELLRDWISSLK